ncbi:MAG: threonylcarbamoyl-AMP synthase [Chloroflexi bacterium]|nr:threonylcarbamoyl-AMP synthase [Chloroflexota bacterium]
MTSLSQAVNDAASPERLAQALEALKKGGVIAFPTDTVYGLGALATDDQAVGKLFRLKGRSAGHPLPILVADLGMAEQTARLSPAARALARACWPGPLTLVLPRQPAFRSLALAGGETVAVRQPAHRVPLALMQALSAPITGTSANRSGHPSPKTADEVRRQLGQAVDLIWDAGPCPGGQESTIIDLSGPRPVVLRVGPLSLETIAQVLGRKVLLAEAYGSATAREVN